MVIYLHKIKFSCIYTFSRFNYLLLTFQVGILPKVDYADLRYCQEGLCHNNRGQLFGCWSNLCLHVLDNAIWNKFLIVLWISAWWNSALSLDIYIYYKGILVIQYLTIHNAQATEIFLKKIALF